MSNEEMIKEELENLGCKALDDTHYLDGILPFIDDTYRIFIKVFYLRMTQLVSMYT